MRKIFRYECRRLLWNKFFIGLAVLLLFYGALGLHGVTLPGGSPTAPLSPLPPALGWTLCGPPATLVAAIFLVKLHPPPPNKKINVMLALPPLHMSLSPPPPPTG